MTTERVFVDCRTAPSEKNCSLLIAGTTEEVLAVAVDHAVAHHQHERTPQLRDEIRRLLAPEKAGNAQRTRSLALGIYEAFNRRDFDALERVADANCTSTNCATGEVLRGPKGFRSYAEGWARAFPDAKVEIDRIIAGDDGYVVEFVGSGTHKGPLSSPMGTVQPTGRRLRLRFAETATVRDGKVVDERSYFDLASMMAQLGVAPQPLAQAGAQPEPKPQHRQ